MPHAAGAGAGGLGMGGGRLHLKIEHVGGAPDLAKIAVESPGAHRAFIKHLFHHLVQQPTNSFGFTTMDALHEDFTKNNFNIRHLVKTIAKTNAIN